MHKTRNDLPKSARSKLAKILQDRLSDAIDLQQQCKQAHWNVRGPSFIALHELFDKIAGEVEEHADLLAERIAQLGGAPDGTVRTAAKGTSLKEYPRDISAGSDHVEALSAALADFGARARADIDRTGKLGDADSADILTEISRASDKALWFVEAHGQAKS